MRSIIGAIILLGFCSVPVVAADEPEQTPNVIIIYTDDLGYGDISCYNPESKILTPQIDSLAAEGMMFTDAHTSAAICTPSRYGLLTGRNCWRSYFKTGVLGGYDLPIIS
jgi:arylsulfatase A